VIAGFGFTTSNQQPANTISPQKLPCAQSNRRLPTDRGLLRGNRPATRVASFLRPSRGNSRTAPLCVVHPAPRPRTPHNPALVKLPRFLGAAARRNSVRCCGTATPGQSWLIRTIYFRVSLHTLDRPLTKPRFPPPGFPSFQRCSQAMIISVCDPQREQTSRLCQSGTGVSGRIAAPFRRDRAQPDGGIRGRALVITYGKRNPLAGQAQDLLHYPQW
jgi:hypothetical protein